MLEILGVFYRPLSSPPAIETERSAPPTDADAGTSVSDSQPQAVACETKMEGDSVNDNKRGKKREGAPNKQVECKVCNKKVSGMNHLKNHMLLHDTRLHTCPYCHAYFKRVFNLGEHVKKHQNVKYTCETCDKSYSDRSSLRAHKQAIHLQKCKLGCTTCGKRFYSRSHLSAHERSHSGERPFACDFCGKTYAHLASVRKHRQAHCAVAKYRCRLCGKCFRWLLGIRQHLTVQHKLKKCDVDAQVIMSETLPLVDPSGGQITGEGASSQKCLGLGTMQTSYSTTSTSVMSVPGRTVELSKTQNFTEESAKLTPIGAGETICDSEALAADFAPNALFKAFESCF